MNFDTFRYPYDEEKIQAHIKANRIGKIQNRDGNNSADFNIQWRHHKGEKCEDCGRTVMNCPPFKWSESEQELESRYGIYGPNCVIYLGFIKRIAVFMLICSLVFGIPLLVINLSGSNCSLENYCNSNSLIYKWSAYNILGANSAVRTQAWLWLTFYFALAIFTFYLRYYTYGTYRSINNKNTTDSDYSLILRNLPQETTAADIRNFAQQQLRKLNPEYGWNKHSSSFVRDVIMVQQESDFFSEHQDQVQEFKKLAKEGEQSKFVPKKLKEPNQFANAAIIRFHDKRAGLKLVEQAEIPVSSRIVNYWCPHYKPKTKYRIRQEKISLQIAPHPTDILWQNFGISQKVRLIGKTIITLIAFGILVVSSGLALGISYWIQLIISKKSSEPILLTICVVLVVMSFNKLISKVVVSMTRIYNLDNLTQEDTQQISLIVIHQSLNLGFFSAIAPILVKLPDEIAKKTTQSSSFPTVMFTTILIQAIVVNVLDFLIYKYDVKQKIFQFLHRKKISLLTETQALRKLKGTEVTFVKQYAYNVKMFWFGFLYGVVSPIAMFITFIGMTLNYYFERFLFNSKYSIPYYGLPRINYELIDLLEWTPLLVGAFNMFLYLTTWKERQFEIDTSVIRIYTIMIILGVVHLIVPWNQIVESISHSSKEEVNIPFDPKMLQITYQQSNPATRPTPNIIYREFNIMQNTQQEKEAQSVGLTYNKYYKHQNRNGPATFDIRQ